MSRSRSKSSQLCTVLLTGLLAGAVLAMAALPAAALFGAGAIWLGARYGDLPEELLTPATAQRSDLYAANGTTLITSFYEENRVDVPLDQVSPIMRQAMVAAEDVRFNEHRGVDPRGVLRALVANRAGGEVRQGASTLTMQYVRNVLKSDPNRTAEQRAEATATNAGRKLREVRYALTLERQLSKPEILGRYLNIAYFGAGAYGIAAASERYFSKPPGELDLAEAALLAGLVRSPDVDNPIDGNAEGGLARRSYVLDQLVETGVVPAAEADRVRAGQLRLRPSERRNDCTATPDGTDDWGFFCDYLLRWWDEQPAFGATVADRREALRRGGYRIVGSLDPAIQAEAMRRTLAVYGYADQRAMPMAVVQPGTGRVLAMTVNRHYRLAPNPNRGQNHPNTVNQLIAGGSGIQGYQAGSTFKLFTLLAAVEAGYPLDTTFTAPDQLLTNYPATGPASCGGYWCPANATPSSQDGQHTMWSAFGKSVNTYFVRLIERVGADRVVAMAQRLGITFRADDDAALASTAPARWGAFTLGVAATTPLDLANAYAAVAAEGRYCRPLPVTSVTDPAGRPVPAGVPRCAQVVSPDVARAATDAARCPVGNQSAYQQCAGGTASEATSILAGRQIAGKTGSSEEYATESFVLFTPSLAAAAMAANPDDPSDPVGQAVQRQVIDAVAWTMATALRSEPARKFAVPARAVVFAAASGRSPVDLGPAMVVPDRVVPVAPPRVAEPGPAPKPPVMKPKPPVAKKPKPPAPPRRTTPPPRRN